MAKDDDGVSFNKHETEALKQIVEDWLGEEIVALPFTPEIKAILDKLSMAEPESHGASHGHQKQAPGRSTQRRGT